MTYIDRCGTGMLPSENGTRDSILVLSTDESNICARKEEKTLLLLESNNA